ncbi:MAG: glutathione S-transferase family protein [Methyloceanibacter sp.]
MIEVYSWPTSNGHKVHILLEEIGCDYRVVPVNIRTGDQFKPEFLAISPNGKIPAIVDRDGPDGAPISIFESGAILMYLAEKYGRFMPQPTRERYGVIQWLMFQMGSVGPMLGQALHFNNYTPEPVPYGVARYTREAERIYRVLDTRLAASEYLAGDDYTIADISVFPWVTFYKRLGVDPEHLTHFMRWLAAIKARPAVKRGLEVLKEHRLKPEQLDDNAKKLLFGNAPA